MRAQAGPLLWGECQGSGANPYRVVADTADVGTKCTCPSRKFPCKHALALLWLAVDDPCGFAPGEPPQWVHDWMGRRRKTTRPPAASSEAKSLDAAREASPPTTDPAADAKRAAAAERRAADTRSSVMDGLEEMERWIADQLRAGLAAFLTEPGERCRRIAARLVDAKAGSLASRIDEMPSRLLALPGEERVDAAIMELGKLVLLSRAWRAAPDDPELHREVIRAETRDELLSNPETLRVRALWEVLGERVVTRRDGLISQSTWLLNLGPHEQRFALLLDFFPASNGRRAAAAAAGDRFVAELAFYSARRPLRAVVVERGDGDGPLAWPASPADSLAIYEQSKGDAPWQIEVPLLLPAGRLAEEETKAAWWQPSDGNAALPLRETPPTFAMGAEIAQAAALWDGTRLSLLAAKSNWGALFFDE